MDYEHICGLSYPTVTRSTTSCLLRYTFSLSSHQHNMPHQNTRHAYRSERIASSQIHSSKLPPLKRVIAGSSFVETTCAASSNTWSRDLAGDLTFVGSQERSRTIFFPTSLDDHSLTFSLVMVRDCMLVDGQSRWK
jgi:hypothetical protein